MISFSLNSYLIFLTRNKQLYEVMQKEIHIPVTKIRYVCFVSNRCNWKEVVATMSISIIRVIEYFKKNLNLDPLQQNS